MLFRAAYFTMRPREAMSILDASSWVNGLTSLIVAVLPVISTTAILVTCSERIRRQWEVAATTDYLTRLPNRLAISSTGALRFNAAQRSGASFALGLIDIDHFKLIDDQHGHDVGDEATTHIANVLATKLSRA